MRFRISAMAENRNFSQFCFPWESPFQESKPTRESPDAGEQPPFGRRARGGPASVDILRNGPASPKPLHSERDTLRLLRVRTVPRPPGIRSGRTKDLSAHRVRETEDFARPRTLVSPGCGDAGIRTLPEKLSPEKSWCRRIGYLTQRRRRFPCCFLRTVGDGTSPWFLAADTRTPLSQGRAPG